MEFNGGFMGFHGITMIEPTEIMGLSEYGAYYSRFAKLPHKSSDYDE